jgi:acyl-coenzyme A synthetase/AMP-(fatty) acid ligase
LVSFFLFSHQYPTFIPLLSHSFCMPYPSHPPWLDDTKYIWQIVQIMKLHIMQFSPIFYCILCQKKMYTNYKVREITFGISDSHACTRMN